MTTTIPDISVIVPVYNEKDSVALLHREIVDSLASLNLRSEIIFVDDDSDDGTFQTLSQLRPIKIVKLRQNTGQSAALDAGIKQARGPLLVTLDGDGQNDPRDIPALLNKLDEGYDMVCGWRIDRKDPFLKHLVSRGARLFRRLFVDDDLHDSGCTLKAYRRECFEDLDLFAQLHRMIPALLKWRGYRITEVPVHHRPRIAGKSKYDWKRIVHGLLDMMYIWFWRKYSARPFHLFGAVGLGLIALGGLLLLLMAYLKLFHGYMLSNKIWPLAGFFCVLVGVQMLAAGLLAANQVEKSGSRKYYIEKIIEKT